MIKVLYFARFRDRLGTSEEQWELPENGTTVEGLMLALAERGGEWAELFQCESGKVLVAVNQEMCGVSTRLYSGDEVAFFPPVTGG